MTNDELNRILKDAPAPERTAGHWEEFPGRVMREIRRTAGKAADTVPDSSSSAGWRPKLQFGWGLAAGLATVCIALGFFLGLWKGRNSGGGTDSQLAAAQKYFHEIEGLFPNQVQAIVFDQNGPHIVLADHADVPASTALYLKICDAQGCRRFVTFSGQRVRVNGDAFDVLVDRQGDVLLVGEQAVWSSSKPAVTVGRYRIEARPLETRS
jgi:hypothetical protein